MDLPVISLFTGCGGMEIGLERAGFRTAACVEIDKDCRETLALNRPGWPIVLVPGQDRKKGGEACVLEEKAVKVGDVTGETDGSHCILSDDSSVELDDSYRIRERKSGRVLEKKPIRHGHVWLIGEDDILSESGERTKLDRSRFRIVALPRSDITRLSSADILAASGLNRGQAALVTGGCPCQPFSTIGKRDGTESDDGNLFRHFMRIVEKTRPCGFIFENVPGIRQHPDVWEFILNHSREIGYATRFKVLNAADYGVPQRRKRFIALGLRGVVEPEFPLPTHTGHPSRQPGREPWVTVRQCFSSIRPDDMKAALQMGVSPRMEERMSFIRKGTNDNFKQLPDDLRPNCWKNKEGGHQGGDTFGRLEWDKPAVTIRASGYHPMKGRYIHPEETRGLNTVEMSRLQGFPVEWRFAGGLISVSRQIGNAVPPVLSEALGRAMARQMDLGPTKKEAR